MSIGSIIVEVVSGFPSDRIAVLLLKHRTPTMYAAKVMLANSYQNLIKNRTKKKQQETFTKHSYV